MKLRGQMDVHVKVCLEDRAAHVTFVCIWLKKKAQGNSKKKNIEQGRNNFVFPNLVQS